MKQLDCHKLIDTEWVNQFDERQLIQIRAGLGRKLDVSIYAKPEFDGEQMYQIRTGMQLGVDVSVYANPTYSEAEMCDIKYGLVGPQRLRQAPRDSLR